MPKTRHFFTLEMKNTNEMNWRYKIDVHVDVIRFWIYALVQELWPIEVESCSVKVKIKQIQGQITPNLLKF